MNYVSTTRLELLDGDALRRDLTALAHATSDKTALRKEALGLIKSVFNGARNRVRDRSESGAMSGLAVSHALSDLQDVLLQVLYDFACKHFYLAQNPTQAEHLAIVATGGYGRSRLAPYSDIDLLFLRPYKQTPWGESVIEFILHMLWDLGLKVGHATRSLAECLRLSKKDLTIRTTLLEARFLWGDRALYDDLRKQYWAEVGTGQDFVEAKLTEREQRHFKQGESRYLVEPNIKEGKGGLRDLQTLYWMGKFLYHTDEADDLIEHGVFTREEYKTFQLAEAFLWDVRVQLHYAANRAEERLTFDLQPEISRRLGFTGESARRAVEKFMRAYFLVAKDVGDLTRIFCAALEEQNKKPKPSLSRMLPGFLKPRVASDDFFVENGRLNARGNAFRDPLNLIRIFHVADAKDIDVHPTALRTITRSLDSINDELRNNPEANRLFLDVLTSRRDPERALRRMNEAGVLGRFIPAFDHAVGLMQFNMYHHFTVDEHLIRAVGNVASIERGELKSDHPLASDIVKRIKSRDVLYCAILFHDIAKGLPGNHSIVGAEIAEPLGLRLGLSQEDAAAVAWLVNNHLVMSDTAQRRDLSDPNTVRNFVATVQSPEKLRLLLVLTVADIRAVGPGVWNGWKGQLLRELYYEAENAMSGGDAAPARAARIASAKAKLEDRIGDLSSEARARALSRYPDAYWLAFNESEHEHIARLASAADAKGNLLSISAESDVFRAVTELVVYTPDHPGLFSKLSGAIAVSGGSIVDAKAFTTSDGFALDVFSLQDAEGEAFDDAPRLARLQQTINKTLSGEIIPRKLLAARPRKKRVAAFQVRARASFDNQASAIATVIEVECLDRQGLLYEVTQAIFESGLSISSSIVATYGERAVDVFYVRDGFGHKITHRERLSGIEQRLSKALSGETLEKAAPLRA